MAHRSPLPLTKALGKDEDNSVTESKSWPTAVRVAAVLLLLVICLVCLHLVTQWLMNRSPVESIVRNDLPTYRLRYRLLNLDREMSLPAWFSSTLLCGVGLTMWVAAWVHRRCAERGAWSWGLLGLFFVLLSLDESSAIHEVLVPRVQAMLGEHATGLLYYAWYLPVLLLCSVFLLVLLPFLLRLPRRTFWLLAMGVAVYLAGAVVFEALMGMAVEPSGVDEPPLQNPPMRMVFLLVMEEGLEMVGITLLLYAMLDYLSPRLRVQIKAVKPNSA